MYRRLYPFLWMTRSEARPSEHCRFLQVMPLGRKWCGDCWWDQRGHQRRTGRRLITIRCWEVCLASHWTANTAPQIDTGNLGEILESLHKSWIKWGLLIEVRLGTNILIRTDRFAPVLYLSYKDHLITIFRSNSETIVLMQDVHLHLSMGVALEGVVDVLSKNLII